MTQHPDPAWQTVLGDLKAVVGRRGVHGPDADDVIQTAIEKALVKRDQLADGARFDVWLKAIAANVAIDFLRAQRRALHQVDIIDALENVQDEEARGAAGETGQSSLMSYADCVRPLLSQLSAQDAEAIRLKDLDGLSFADMAEQLGLSIPGAKSRVQRGRARLARALTDCCRDALEVNLDQNGPAHCDATCCRPER